MPLKEKVTENRLLFGLLLHDRIAFRRFFWSTELSLPLSFDQRLMCADDSERVLNCTGRKTAKTINLEALVIQIGLLHESGYAEAMFFTPGQAQMSPVRDRIVSRLNSNALFRAIKENFNKNEGILDFKGGLRFFFKIEGSSGTEENMVGLRCIHIIGDELAFGNQRCHDARFQTALPGCTWTYAGVPNGVRDTPFYRLDQTDQGLGWSKHKMTTYANPIYQTEKAKEKLVKDYGGENTQEYVTQVLGEWGEEVFSSFPPGSIAIKKELPYEYQEFTGKQIERFIKSETLSSYIRLPRVSADRYIVSMDHGFSPDPSTIMVFYEAKDKEWHQLARFKLLRVADLHQAKVLDFINVELLERKVACICTDDIGIIQALQNKDEATSLGYSDDYEAKCFLAQPGGTIEVGEEEGEPIKKRLKQWMMEELRKSMTYANLKIPYDYHIWLAQDDEVEQELRGTTERTTPSGMVVYVPERRGVDHNTETLRYLVAALHHLAGPGQQEESFEGLGWVSVGDRPWKPPWG